MGTIRDLPNQVATQAIYHEQRATSGSETRTTNDGNCTAFDARGHSKRALGIVVVGADANAAAADSVTVTFQKCTSAAGAGATTLVAATAVAGTGSAQVSSQEVGLDLETLGETSGTPYRYIRASVAYVDANSSGTYDVSVVIVADAHYSKPVS